MFNSPTRYCILGGAGSFAIHTALYLLGQSEKNTVVGIGRNPIRARPEAFTLGIEAHPRFTYIPHHVTHEHDELMETLEKEQPEIIINFAAQGEGAVSRKDSWRFYETNCVGLVRLAEKLTKKLWLRRFIQIGTSEMYGAVTEPAGENAQIKPTSPYAVSKVAFDMHLASLNGALKYNIVRPSNCYCPGQLLHRVVPKAIVCGLTGRKLPLEGGGKAKKSYLHARDLARAIQVVACAAPVGKTYNVGPDTPSSIKEVVERCADALGMTFEQLCWEVPGRPGEDSQYWLDSTEIKKMGWKQTVFWEDGLKEMVEWGRQYLPVLKDWPSDYRLRA